LLFALLAVIVVAALLQRIIRWSPIAFMTQVICALGVLITMVDAVARAKDSLVDIRSPYAVLFGSLLLIVIPWRHLDRHDFSKPRPITLAPDEIVKRGVDLRSKNVLVAGIAIVFAVAGVLGTYEGLGAALPASSTSPVMNGASVNALLLASSGVAQFEADSAKRLLSYQGGEYGVSSPVGLASDGSHIWVANAKSNTVTEFIAKTGTVVRVLASSVYALNNPTAVASDGRFVFVLNSSGNSVTQINTRNGELVRVISGSRFQLNSPFAEAIAGDRLWITSPSTNTITVINARTGALINLISSVTSPTLLAAQGSSMWVANSLGAVVRIDGHTNQITGRVSIGTPVATNPGGLAVLDNSLFVSDPLHSSLWQFDVNTFAEIRNINGDPYGFSAPGALSTVGPDVLVLNTNGNVVTVVSIISTNAGVAHRYNVADVPYPGFGGVLYSNGRVWVTY
jgi:sugar lactone lactonase YvrE